MKIFFYSVLISIFLFNSFQLFGQTSTKYISTASPTKDTAELRDADLDGIPDSTDKCPNTPGYARYDGCSIPDTDQDGINDEIDNCPKTFGKAQYMGCPDLQRRVDLWLKTNPVVFATNPDKKVFQSLDSIVALLKNFPQITMEISTPNTDIDTTLPKKELNSKDTKVNGRWVESYLVNKSINLKRLLLTHRGNNSKTYNNNSFRFTIHYTEW